MSSAEQARRTRAKVMIAGVDITSDVSRNLLSVQYTDNEEDTAPVWRRLFWRRNYSHGSRWRYPVGDLRKVSGRRRPVYGDLQHQHRHNLQSQLDLCRSGAEDPRKRR